MDVRARIWKLGRVAAIVLPGLGGLAVGSLPASASTLRVPQDQPTIQQAINVAKAGDTVLVSPGTYYEHINFLGKDVKVKGEQGRDVTTIDGQANPGTVVTIAGGETSKALLMGFTITHGTTTGIVVRGASPTIKNNRITGNTVNGHGAGISLENSSTLLEYNYITNNSQVPLHCGPDQYCQVPGYLSGGGVSITGTGSPQVYANIITGNTADYGGGISVQYAENTPSIVDNRIQLNNAGGAGGGIHVSQNWQEPGFGRPEIVQNLVSDNTAGTAGGVFVNGGVRFINNTVANNLANNAVRAIDHTQFSALYFMGGYSGSNDQTGYWDNILTGPSSMPAVYCDTGYSQSIPTLIVGNDAYNFGGTPTAGNCTAAFDPSNFSNIEADPLYKNQKARDYHVLPNSPTIDAEVSSYWVPPVVEPTDFSRVDPRVQGDHVDMGVYETAPPATT
ncbi:MAG: hypothetical protein QOE92_447 [Chloroflexota bacterium]|jgi:parallel beta-helix repeat protein|nr:hypothetical protein [Chloroflexota bacterium]